MAFPTVREVWRLALPTATELLGGEDGLTRPVQWARRMSMFPPAFADLEAGEILLLDVEWLTMVDERLTLARVVEALAEQEANALAVIGEVSGPARAAADEHTLPLLALPDETDLRDIERDIVRLIVEHEAQLDRRGRQVYRRLAQLSIGDQGLAAIAHELESITGKPVVIQDQALTVLAEAWPEGAEPASEAVRDALADEEALADWLWGQKLDGKSPPHTTLELPVADWARALAAIVIERDLRGYLSLLSPEGVIDDLDRLAVERGALVCAVEVAKRRAVEAVEDRLRGDFLDLILTAGEAEERALGRRAAEMGYELAGYHAVVIFNLKNGVARRLPLLASEFRAHLMNSDIHTLLGPYDDSLVALCSAEDSLPLRRLEELAQATQERLETLVPEAHVAVGIGRTGKELAGLRRSFVQAREALKLSCSLFSGERVMHFNDLGVYRLLCRLQGSDDLREFYEQTLGPLAEYDAGHKTEMVTTLEAFFEHHGNVSRTAESLFLHRNSLLYRLDRIGEITGMELDDADDRFALQLALKVQPLLEG